MTETLTPTAVVETHDGLTTVGAYWPGVDRPTTGGIAVSNAKLAARLAAAINAGVVYTDARVATDVNGKTYVAARSMVLGRRLNADLRRLGF